MPKAAAMDAILLFPGPRAGFQSEDGANRQGMTVPGASVIKVGR